MRKVKFRLNKMKQILYKAKCNCKSYQVLKDRRISRFLKDLSKSLRDEMKYITNGKYALGNGN